MSYKIDLDGLLSELRSRVVGDHSSVVKSSASKLNQHGVSEVESALSDVIPSSLLLVSIILLLVGIIGSFVTH